MRFVSADGMPVDVGVNSVADALKLATLLCEAKNIKGISIHIYYYDTK